MTTKTEAVTSAVSANLADSLATLINKTIAGVDAASGFLQEQIPDVIHQLLMWKMVEALFTAAILLISIAVVGTLLYKFYLVASEKMKINKLNDDHMVVTIISAILYMIFGAIPSLIIFYQNVNTALQIWIAPKVWLIEYAASLVKGN